MVKIGASVYQNFAEVDVPNIGVGFSDQWQRVALLPQAQLPDRATVESYVFIAWCSIGHFQWTVQSSQNAVVEVAIGTHNGPEGAAQRHRLIFNDARYSRGVRRDAAQPVFWVYSRTSSVRGTWVGDMDGIAIWARISANGDLPGLIQGSFRITNIGIQAFSLRTVTGTQSFVVRNVFGPLRLEPAFSSRQVYMTSTSGVFDGTGTWLGFCSIRYWPGTHGKPQMHVIYSPDGTHTHPGVLILHGLGTRGVGLKAFYTQFGGMQNGGRWDQQLAGGWFTIQNPVAAGEFGVWAHDPLGATGSNANCALAEFEIFLIKASVVLAQFTQDIKNPTATATLWNKLGQSPPVTEPYEWTRPFDADTEIIFQGGADASVTGSPSYFAVIETNERGSALVQRGAMLCDRDQTVLAHMGTRFQLRGGLIQTKFYGTQSTFESAQPENRQSDDHCVASWQWENAPNTTPTPKPPDVSMTFLVPNRESLDAGSLLALPIAPDVDMDEILEAPRHEFVARDGTKLTWPRWLGVRRTFSFSWSGMSNADKDTLLAFFLANRMFKWTQFDQGDVIALALVGGVESQDVGLRHVVRIQAVELVWTGTGV